MPMYRERITKQKDHLITGKSVCKLSILWVLMLKNYKEYI